MALTVESPPVGGRGVRSAALVLVVWAAPGAANRTQPISPAVVHRVIEGRVRRRQPPLLGEQVDVPDNGDAGLARP